MEKIREDLQSEKLKSLTAIRCAKAAILLSSLKNATKNSITDVPQLQDEEMIGKLMIQLMKEKQKRKKLSQLIGISLIFLFIVLLIYPFFLISL